MTIRHIVLLSAIILAIIAYISRSHSTRRIIMSRAPVYFISHGGPPSLFTPGSKPYEAWKRTGSRIRQEVKEGRIKGLICVSAHWEADGKEIEVNSNTSNPLIYDFYNFPKHYYDEKFTSSSTSTTLQSVLSTLSASSIPTTTFSRGLDHGLWVPFKAMFAQEPKVNGNALTEGCGDEMPQILQVSLPKERSGVQEYVKLGKALSALRDQGYAIVATGQPVHNLRAYRGGGASSSAFSSFISTIHKTITTTPSSSLIQGITGLMSLPNYKTAHPTDEHFLPLVVAAAAAAPADTQQEGTEEVQKVETLLNFDEGALGWYIARWD